MRILHIASESVPFAKTGGLADVVGALPLAQAAGGHEVSLILPYYDQFIKNPLYQLPQIEPMPFDYNVDMGPAGYFAIHLYRAYLEQGGAKVTCYLIGSPVLFNRAGLYQEDGRDYADNLVRFAFFAKAALIVATCLNLNPQIIHGHDWQAGLSFALIAAGANMAHFDAALVLTVHNLGYQGIFQPFMWDLLGLPSEMFSADGLEFYGNISLLKAGLTYADAIATVSPTYAREITSQEYGYGFDGLLRARHWDLFGILNGLDTATWNPQKDTYIAAHYSAADPSGKALCKAALQKKCGFKVAPDKPVLGLVSRMAYQKGVEHVINNAEYWLSLGGQLAICGNGETGYVEAFKNLAATHPDAIFMETKFSEEMAHQIEAGSDFFIMPSRYEPCGLNQMISLVYGTIPIVRRTGGLMDTVFDYEWNEENGNGITFDDFSSQAVADSLTRARRLFDDRELMTLLKERAMKSDFSWERAAGEYLELYYLLGQRLGRNWDAE